MLKDVYCQILQILWDFYLSTIGVADFHFFFFFFTQLLLVGNFSTLYKSLLSLLQEYKHNNKHTKITV